MASLNRTAAALSAIGARAAGGEGRPLPVVFTHERPARWLRDALAADPVPVELPYTDEPASLDPFAPGTVLSPEDAKRATDAGYRVLPRYSSAAEREAGLPRYYLVSDPPPYTVADEDDGAP